MNNLRKKVPVQQISIDELREKENEENESTFFEYQLGLFCEMNTDAIGIRADLSRLFKQGLFSDSEKKALVRKLADFQLSQAERKAFHRALIKLRNFYLN